MAKSEVLRILDNPLVSRSSYTWRYSSSRLMDPENLSTHVYEVVMIGLMLIDGIKSRSEGKEDIDVSLFLWKALFHDADETVIGDIPRPLKYASEGIHTSLESVAHSVASSLFEDTFSVQTPFVEEIYRDSKKGKEGKLVKLSDMLCVVKKSRVEIEKLGNLTFLDTILNLRSYVNSMDQDDFYSEFISSGAIEYLREIMNDVREYTYYMEKKYLEGSDWVR